MGDLVSGDLVFGRDGKPCRVLVAHPPYVPALAYALTFDDGSSQACDADHLWVTAGRFKGKRESGYKTRSTAEIVATLKRSDGGAAHAMPIVAAVELPESELPVHPYVLGVYLADGGSKECSITGMDEEIFDAIDRLGFPLHGVQVLKNNRAATFTFVGLRKALRELGVSPNKHIPAVYLRASHAQRLELMRGLVDGDGYINPDSHTVEYTSVRRELAEQVMELALSLGWKATSCEGLAKLNGRIIGPKWRICFHASEPPCSLPRKLRAWQPRARSTTWHRYVIDAQTVKPSLMRCITVDSPDKTYCCGRNWLVTHNTWSLCLEALRWVHVPRSHTMIFREHANLLTGGPNSLYANLLRLAPPGYTTVRSPIPELRYPGDSVIQLRHSHTDKSVFDGVECSLSMFDEIQNIPRDLVEYVSISRGRTLAPINPYMRASCMPLASSWVADLVQPWLREGGYQDFDQSGRVRWFYRDNKDALCFFDSKEDADDAGKAIDAVPMSLAFVFARTSDNKALMAANPEYERNLSKLDAVERLRLRDACWAPPAGAGILFQRGWFEVHDQLDMHQVVASARGWDRAATEPHEKNRDPDWTRGVRLDLMLNGQIIVSDVVGCRRKPATVLELISDTAALDGPEVAQCFFRDPGSAGITEEHVLREYLDKRSNIGPCHIEAPTGNKEAYARAVSAYADRSHGIHARPGMGIVRAGWNSAFLYELEQFPSKGVHDDQVDAMSRAFFHLRMNMIDSSFSNDPQTHAWLKVAGDMVGFGAPRRPRR